MRPDGKKGAGLFAYLRGLQSESGKARQDVIANVFKGVTNRMESGYLLRDVINKVSGIHFTASEEMHTLSRLYENMLREMRDAAGDSGEFYTPRPVVKFMVDVTEPKLGETVLDPACGTGGFLVEAYDHLAASCKSVADRRVLQQETLFGQEAKPLPYMLVQMNLLLHGLEYPNIKYGNTLAVKVTEIGDNDRVDVILTNPPFGGEEERGILNNFPADKQTAETALLFLQLIMRKLKRPARGTAGPRRRRRAQRHALRRWRLRPHQGGAAQGLQPPHHRPPARGHLRALHRHPDQSPLLRPLRPHADHLVLRGAAARGPEEIHQDHAHAGRGHGRVQGMVHREEARRERAGLED